MRRDMEDEYKKELEKQQSKAREDAKKAQEGNLCPICLDAGINMVFNCGHQVCSTCGEKLQVCHVCRKKLRQRSKHSSNHKDRIYI